VTEATDFKIVIRHVSGAKANQTQEFDGRSRDEILLGRAVGNDVIYDSPRDDVVSRSHASIRIAGREPLSFSLEDRNSANGTFLGGEKISGKTELLPEDKVSLGRNGPSFIFDVRPRPAELKARTVVMKVGGSAETRVLEAAEAMAAASTVIDQTAGLSRGTANSTTDRRSAGTARRDDAAPFADVAGGKKLIGEQTLVNKIKEAQSSANSRWLMIAGGLAALLLFAGGFGALKLYQKEDSSEQGQKASLAQMQAAVEEAREQGRHADAVATTEKQERGKSPLEIVQKYGPATAKVKVDWRLFDTKTGRPIFQKSVTEKGTTRKYRLYVKLSDGSVVRYLTLDDGERNNLPIRGHIEGTAFVVSENGFLLTNKHLAAAWRLPFSECECTEKEGLLLEKTGKRKNKLSYRLIDLDQAEYANVRNWIPEGGGYIFASDEVRTIGPYNLPDPSKNEKYNFVGRNELVEAVFSGATSGMAATLVRSSNDSDAALIKVDSPEPLRKVDLASGDDRVSPGEHIVVLGYPSIAAKVLALSSTIENGTYRTSAEEVPQPYVTDGIVALVSTRMSVEAGSNVTYAGVAGNIMQLTINSTGKGNSGGPVFDSTGKVIGLFTYIQSEDGAANSAAVPINYGRALLKPQ
jgi:S1-C subfamily serine protease/pSer/pThr/pTyr-binding forkhead associated (FHA) protein